MIFAAIAILLTALPAAAAPASVGYTDANVGGNTASRGDASGRLHVTAW